MTQFYLIRYAMTAVFVLSLQAVQAHELPTPTQTPAYQNPVVSVSAAQLTELNHQLIADRRASLRRMGDAKYFGFYNSYVRGHDILAATALQGCGKPEWINFIVDLPDMPSTQEPTEMFGLPVLVRYLYQYGACLTESQKQQLLKKLMKRQILLGHGTTNHAIVKASSWFLLAQYFPSAMWIDAETKKTYSSQQLMAALKPLLAARTKRVFESGHYEWLSPNYAILNVYPLLNLIDFSSDDEVKNNASDEAILEISLLRVNSFHGVIVPPLTRKNFDQRNALDTPQKYEPAIAQQLIWYYFGEPAALGLYDFRSGSGAFFVSMLGISSWLPPDPVLALNPSQSNSSLVNQTLKIVTPRFSMWGNSTEPEIYGDSIITDDFSIGTGNLYFDPYGYSGHIQTFSILLKSTKPHNEIECYQPFWHSALGEDAWDVDRSSPFQQMLRYDDTSVVMLFDIPKTDPWKVDQDKSSQKNRFWEERSKNSNALLQLVTCRFARDFDEIIQEPNWVFVRHGNVFVAMATLKGVNGYAMASNNLNKKFSVVKIHEPKTALFFRVEKQTSDLNFAQFQHSVRNNLPLYDPQKSSIRMTDKNGAKIEMIFEIRPPIKGSYWSALPKVIKDGQVVQYENHDVVHSPELSLQGGVLTIKTMAGELTLSH